MHEVQNKSDPAGFWVLLFDVKHLSNETLQAIPVHADCMRKEAGKLHRFSKLFQKNLSDEDFNVLGKLRMSGIGDH